ncbi:MAG: tetratricopeptide repeat protein [Calditrichaeota bacterium]|nr:MAG: tetratricopeptide repeat protein [Calditrichota bacterium]
MWLHVLAVLFAVFAGGEPVAQGGRAVVVADTASVRIDRENHRIPIWLRAHQDTVRGVRIQLAQIRKRSGEQITLPYEITPERADIYPEEFGQFFTLSFQPADVQKLLPGEYEISLFISAENAPSEVRQLRFSIPAPPDRPPLLERAIAWTRETLLVLAWSTLEMLSSLFLIAFVVWFFVLAWRGRNSIHVAPIANETGESGELDGIAAGIDDLLMVKLQEIAEIMKQDYVLRPDQEFQREADREVQTKLVSQTGAALTFELQSIGDISVGPVKLPLGRLVTLLLKVFGGNYVSGALQKYGGQNKLVLLLEERPPIFAFRENSSYFEANWPSEDLQEGSLAQGVPHVVEELAYRLTLKLAQDPGTQNWQAFRFFLHGKMAFSDYRQNPTRLDRLRDAVECWQSCVKLDLHFVEAHYYLGLAHDIEGKTEDALYRYKKFIQLSPSTMAAQSHLKLAGLYWNKFKDEENALKELDKANKKNPNLAEAYNLRGIIYAKNKDYDGEVELYEKAIKLSHRKPDPIYYYNLSVSKYYLTEFDAAQQAGETALRLFGDKRTRELLQTMGWIHNQKARLLAERNLEDAQQDECARAVGYFEAALHEDPRSQPVLLGLGRALRGCNRLEMAELIQRRHLRLYPQYFEGYQEIALTLEAQGANKALVKRFRAVADVLKDTQLLRNVVELERRLPRKDVSPEQVALHSAVLGGMCHRYYGEYDKAKRFFSQFLKTQTGDKPHYLAAESLHSFGETLVRLKRAEDAIQVLRQAASLYADGQTYSRATCWLLLGDIFVILEKEEDADRSFQLAAADFVKSKLNRLASDAYVKDAKLLMSLHAKTKQESYSQRAREVCNRAIQLNTTNYEAFHVKGNTFYELGRDSEAIPEFEKALEINYNLPGAHYNLGLSYYYLGEYETAIEKFQAAVKLKQNYADPKSQNLPDPYYWLTQSFYKLGRFDDAVACLRRLVNLFPTSTKYINMLGEALSRCGLYDQAAAEFRRALVFDRENVQALNNLASLYADRGANLKEAFALALKALRVGKRSGSNKKTLAEIRLTLGWLCYCREQTRRAILLLENALAYSLEEPKHHARLAYAYERHSVLLGESPTREAFCEKAQMQWRVVASLSENGQWGKIATEHLNHQNPGGV